MNLSATAKVVLGMIREGKRTGYEIKRVVDVSTRFFWAASYGQIYPELRRLEEQGLIEGAEASDEGGRQRRPYRLTAAGEGALDEWLQSRGEIAYELRDEGKLKLFFSDSMKPAERRELVRSMRERHERALERLREIEDGARRYGGGPYMTLRFGIAQHEFLAGWLADLEQELQAQAPERT